MTGTLVNREFITTVRRELSRLARFGANVADAYTCLIFLPSSLLSEERRVGSETLEIVGAHSLSTDLVSHCRITVGSGLIGWVAKHRRTIHVSPFDRDSTTLGIYSVDQMLKSFIGIPVPLSESDDAPYGVVTCDSKKSFAFSKLQGKLLEDLAAQVTSTVSLATSFHRRSGGELGWSAFIRRAQQLCEALGFPSIEVLRLRFTNLDSLEESVGCSAAIDAVDQVHRLIQQALPPHFPSFRLPQGDIVLVVDNMMTSFYENKLRAVCDHMGKSGVPVSVEFARRGLRGRRESAVTLEQLISETCQEFRSLQQPSRGVTREYRTA